MLLIISFLLLCIDKMQSLNEKIYTKIYKLNEKAGDKFYLTPANEKIKKYFFRKIYFLTSGTRDNFKRFRFIKIQKFLEKRYFAIYGKI